MSLVKLASVPAFLGAYCACTNRNNPDERGSLLEFPLNENYFAQFLLDEHHMWVLQFGYRML